MQSLNCFLAFTINQVTVELKIACSFKQQRKIIATESVFCNE